MAYSKTSWSTGDTVTASKLNNIEGQVESDASYVDDLKYAVFPIASGTGYLTLGSYDEWVSAGKPKSVL